VEVGQKLVMRI